MHDTYIHDKQNSGMSDQRGCFGNGIARPHGSGQDESRELQQEMAEVGGPRNPSYKMHD